MAIGPAMLLAALGGLALATMKKGGSSAGPTPGSPPPFVPPGGQGGSSADPIVTTPAGPIPVALPQSFHTMLVNALRDITMQDDGTIKGPVTAEAIQRATTVAAQLDAAGFPDAARALRACIQQAARQVPTPKPDKQAPLPGVSPDLVAQVNRAIQLERDPKKLQAILDGVLASAPPSPERDNLVRMLQATIQQVQAAMVLSDTLKKTDDVLKSPGQPPASTIPAPVIEIPNMVVTAPAPSSAPASEIPDTASSRRAINVANHLRNKIADWQGDVKKAKGHEDQSLVRSFQSAEGLQVDGKMGPGSTLQLAKYTGDLPLVYYWPTSANKDRVLKYRTDLLSVADAHENAGRPQIAAKLRAAAAKERGQAGIVGPMPA